MNETPRYLTLLGLRNKEEFDTVIVSIKEMLKTDTKWVATHLSDSNWRLHLIAAVAYLIDNSLDIQLLWNRVEKWSWVSPQLLAVVSIVDPNFESKCIDLVGKIDNAKTVGSVVAFIPALESKVDFHDERREEYRMGKDIALRWKKQVQTFLQD